MTANLKLVMRPSDRSSRGGVAGLKVGMRLDKYRLVKRLGQGGFATVFAAQDTIEDRHVALKIPDFGDSDHFQTIEDMRREVRIMAGLQHESVLALKDARFIGETFVMVFPLGQETLADRLTRRLSRATSVEFVRQMAAAVGYAHENKVLHRDIKPDNFILFPDNVIRLTDFGLARIERGRHDMSASGTLGYIAPEQAMGKPSYRSDVFSLGLVIYRMFAGELPEYPFEPPLPGYARLRRGLNREFVDWIRKSIDPKPSRRFRDGVAMANALTRIRHLMLTTKSGSPNQSSPSRRNAA
ncbi:MAG: serine/threonine-protein kinase [Planctomycetota bacterium]